MLPGVWRVSVFARQAKCAPQGQAHRTQARQAATRHEDSGPRVREQEHRAHSGTTDPEHAGEDEQSDELVAADLPRGRRQDERQVEQGVPVEHDQEGDGYAYGPERQQAEERVQAQGENGVGARYEQNPRPADERGEGVNEPGDERRDAVARAPSQQCFQWTGKQGYGSIPPPRGQRQDYGAEAGRRHGPGKDQPERPAQVQARERSQGDKASSGQKVHGLVHAYCRQ